MENGGKTEGFDKALGLMKDRGQFCYIAHIENDRRRGLKGYIEDFDCESVIVRRPLGDLVIILRANIEKIDVAYGRKDRWYNGKQEPKY